MPEYFDKSEQPLLSQEDFLKCVNTAFKTQPEVVRDAAAFVYLDKKCEHGLAKNKYYAEQVSLFPISHSIFDEPSRREELSEDRLAIWGWGMRR